MKLKSWAICLASLAFMLAGCSSDKGGSLFSASPSETLNKELMPSGQWQDPDTGLIWMRCTMGQTWTGSGCSGKPVSFDYADTAKYMQQFNAKGGFASHQDWRAPSIEELMTLRKCSKGYWIKPSGMVQAKMPGGKQAPQRCAEDSQKPAIDVEIFPDFEDEWYMTDSILEKDRRGVYTLYFGDGYIGPYWGGFSARILAVRSSK